MLRLGVLMERASPQRLSFVTRRVLVHDELCAVVCVGSGCGDECGGRGWVRKARDEEDTAGLSVSSCVALQVGILFKYSRS